MRRATWRCKLCSSWCTGGPEAATQHLKNAHHGPEKGASAHVALGFVPNLTTDARPYQRRRDRPTIAAEHLDAPGPDPWALIRGVFLNCTRCGRPQSEHDFGMFCR